MEQTLFAGSMKIPAEPVSKVFITVVLENGTEYYIDVADIEIGHNDGFFHGKLGYISGNGNVRRVIR